MSKLSSMIDIESKSAEVANPPATHAKPFPAPSPMELDEFVWGGQYNGTELATPRDEYANPFSGAQTPITPYGAQTPITPYGAQTPFTPYGAQTPKSTRDYLLSRPPSPRQDQVTGLAPSWSYPAMNKWRILCMGIVYFSTGMADGAAGALIPYIEEHYRIGYAVCSLIFVTNAIGFLSAAFLNDITIHYLGRAKSLMLAEVLLIIAYVMTACTPPFAVVVLSFFFMGYGISIVLAMNNVFISTLADSTTIMGLIQGGYGIGATIGPIIATSLVSRGVLWSRYYLVTLGLRVVCLFLDTSFWNYEKEAHTKFFAALQRTASRQVALDEPSKLALLKASLKDRITLIGAIYTFCYQGAEVSISGWVISFLISYRNGDPSSVGYVTAGFWGGITVGRFAFSHAISRIGEKRCLFALGCGAVVFQLLAWLVPNVIGDAVAVSIVGLLLGPVAPCSIILFVRLLPTKIQTSGCSFITSAGSSGAAIAPFLTGLIAQVAGTWVLHPIAIGLFVIMLVSWLFLPKEEKRDD